MSYKQKRPQEIHPEHLKALDEKQLRDSFNAGRYDGSGLTLEQLRKLRRDARGPLNPDDFEVGTKVSEEFLHRIGHDEICPICEPGENTTGRQSNPQSYSCSICQIKIENGIVKRKPTPLR